MSLKAAEWKNEVAETGEGSFSQMFSDISFIAMVIGDSMLKRSEKRLQHSRDIYVSPFSCNWQNVCTYQKSGSCESELTSEAKVSFLQRN